MSQNYSFITSCVGANGDDIDEMIQLEYEEYDNEAFLKLAENHDFKDDILVMLGYTQWSEGDSKKAEELFANDWSVNCYRSRYLGLPALYIVHSGIEHVFIPNELFHQADISEERRGFALDIEDLFNEWFEHTHFPEMTAQDLESSLRSFYLDNKTDIDDYRIVLECFIAPNMQDHERIKRLLREIDNKHLPSFEINTASRRHEREQEFSL